MVNKINKKAQMKIQQMSFMLIAVVIFFVLVGMTVLVVKFSGLKESATKLEEQNALLLVTKIANSPEFSCGNSFENSKSNCLDMDKIMMLKQNIGVYRNFWDVSNIVIRKIYPPYQDIECTIENYPNCDKITLIKQEENFGSENYVSLCRKSSENGDIGEICELGLISVYYEVKQ